MTSLATETDLAQSLPDGTTMPAGDATRALAVASDAVREAAKAYISETDVTVTLPAPMGRKLSLPYPVKDVTSVTVDGAAGSPTYRVDIDGLWCDSGWSTYGGTVSVSYTYGYATVPADIVDLTCQLALEWLDHINNGGGSTAGLKSVKIDDGAETYTDEATAQISPVYIPEATASKLLARFGGAGATVVEYQR